MSSLLEQVRAHICSALNLSDDPFERPNCFYRETETSFCFIRLTKEDNLKIEGRLVVNTDCSNFDVFCWEIVVTTCQEWTDFVESNLRARLALANIDDARARDEMSLEGTDGEKEEDSVSSSSSSDESCE